MRKILILFTSLFLFFSCSVSERISYKTTVYFEDNTEKSYEGSHWEDYVYGDCAYRAYDLAKEKYGNRLYSSAQDFAYQCWGNGTFEFTCSNIKFKVTNIIYD